MKRAISLSQLLNGNPNSKKTKVKESKESEQSNEPETIDLLDSPVKEDIIQSQPKKSKIVPVGEKVSSASVKNFLMMRPPKVEKSAKANAKSSEKGKSQDNATMLDDNQDDNDKEGVLSMQEVINLENENFDRLINPRRISQPVSNVKRTNLKELFTNMRKSKGDNGESEEEDQSRPFKRFNNISKLSYLETPLPTKQLIEPHRTMTEEQNGIQVDFKYLQKRSTQEHSLHYIFDSKDYEELRSRPNEKITTNIIKTRIRDNKHVSLWTQLFQPQTVSEVLLDTRLKKAVNTWILSAFEKLKKPTTRHTLISSRKNSKYTEPGTVLFDGFIIPDDMMEEDEEEGLEEFVPLMILHGDGVGKTTLINTIMNNIQGQILDISSSQNRSKRELLDKLSEYCTSHYVKDKKSYDIVLFDDVDVLFKEHDKQFWAMVETLLLKSRKPIVLICNDINFIPTNLIELCEESKSVFRAKKVLTKTVLAFLNEYSKTLGLEVPQDVLTSIIKSNQKDIRKCLLQLQFLFSYNDSLKITQGALESEIKLPLPGSLSSFSQLYDLISNTDILDYNTKSISLIPGDLDTTVMTPQAIDQLDSFEDDQLRLQYDYMVDYRIHTADNLKNPLLPYEISIGKYLSHQLKEHIGHNPDPTRKIANMERISIDFLSSRIPENSLSTVRKTRNSRRLKEILDRFQGEAVYKRGDHDDTAVDFNFYTTTRRKVAKDLNPYVLEIAKSDLNAKNYNKKQFETISKDIPEADHRDLVHELTTGGVFHPVWFYSNPQTVIDCWTLTKRSSD